MESVGKTGVYSHIKRKYKTDVLRTRCGTSLVVQWLRILLPMQGTRVWALVQENPTCCGATKPVSHNYWALVPQLLKPVHSNEDPTQPKRKKERKLKGKLEIRKKQTQKDKSCLFFLISDIILVFFLFRVFNIWISLSSSMSSSFKLEWNLSMASLQILSLFLFIL